MHYRSTRSRAALACATLVTIVTVGACDAPGATGPIMLDAARAGAQNNIQGSTAGEGPEARDAAHRDLREERASLLAADAHYATLAQSTNLLEALVAPLADDAIFLAPGPGLMRGRDAVRASLAANPANLVNKWQWFAIRADVSSDGQHGYTYGYTGLVLPNGVVLPGKYVAYWQRQEDGAWKISAYKRVARGPGDVSPVPPAGFETPDTKHRRYFPNSTPESSTAAIFAADVAFSDAAASGVAEAFAAYAAPDGAVTGGARAEWVFGPAAIGESFAGVPANFSWAPELGGAAGSGDLGFSVGFVYTANGVGKYFTIWQRQVDGTWKYVVD